MEITQSNSFENNNRIAKNTLLLYFRMFLVMGISLYTSRKVLQALGLTDFGIFNVVGGIIMMFSFLNSSMSIAIQRFFSFEIGRKNLVQLKKVFSMSINIHVMIALFIILLGETIGLWFLNTQLNIPSARINSANWVYQFSIFTLMFTIISVPYNALIIAHEKMNIFALVSILEVILKLLIVFSLFLFVGDKLTLYSFLLFSISAILFLIYMIACKSKIKAAKFVFFWDKELYRSLTNYAAWNLFGSISGIAYNQGINILLNIYFGPLINAARAISFQVYGAVNNFVSNFQTAINPQIIKSFAANDIKYTTELLFRGARYSYFLLLFIIIPILLETKVIIQLWLGVVPEYVIIFIQIILINALLDSISGTLMTVSQATGKIKKYQSVMGTLLFLNLPISYILLENGFNPTAPFVVSLIISTVALSVRIIIVRQLFTFSIYDYFRLVIIKISTVTIFSIFIPAFLNLILYPGILRLLIVSLSSFISITISIYYGGLVQEERNWIRKKLLIKKFAK